MVEFNCGRGYAHFPFMQQSHARLKTSLYRASFFLTEPFADDPDDPDKAVPRTSLYTNFFVTLEGQLFTSQLPRKANDTTW